MLACVSRLRRMVVWAGCRIAGLKYAVKRNCLGVVVCLVLNICMLLEEGDLCLKLDDHQNDTELFS